MPIEIQSLVDGEWHTRNKLARHNTKYTREEVIGAAQVFVQGWHHNYETACCRGFSTLRIFDTTEGREINSTDEVCSNRRAVRISLGIDRPSSPNRLYGATINSRGEAV
jgi:hypothetical protein